GMRSPSFRNDDYIFRRENIVAELKCLVDGKAKDPRQHRKSALLLERHMKRGGTPYFSGRRLMQSKNCSPACQRELSETIARPIRKRIRKANQQIRETKARL